MHGGIIKTFSREKGGEICKVYKRICTIKIVLKCSVLNINIQNFSTLKKS